MFRALLLIFDAEESWKKIAKPPRGLLFILFVHLLPLLLIALGVEAFAMSRLGEGRTLTGQLNPVQRPAVLAFFATAMILNLGMAFAVAKLLQWIASSFRDRATYLQCFTVIAYGLSPLYLAHLLDALPGLNTWVCFGIGIALSVASVFHGIPEVMRPDAAKGFGVALIAAVIMLVSGGLIHFLSIQVLHGELNARFWEQFLR